MNMTRRQFWVILGGSFAALMGLATWRESTYGATAGDSCGETAEFTLRSGIHEIQPYLTEVDWFFYDGRTGEIVCGPKPN